MGLLVSGAIDLKMGKCRRVCDFQGNFIKREGDER